MLQGRQALSYRPQFLKTDVCCDKPPTILEPLNDLAPGINDHGISPGFPIAVVSAELGRSYEITGILDGSRLEQGCPMRKTRAMGKCRWDNQDFGAIVNECSIQFGKSQVITD